jgi:GTP-binding protein YchF
MKVGIIGLQYSGKTTLFEAITGAHGMAVDRSAAVQAATIAVPDERIDRVAETVKPEKVTYAHVDFLDAAGVTSDMARDQTVKILSALRDVDGMVNVVRFFDSPSAPPHPHGPLDPKRDLAEMEAELVITDLDIVENRIERLEKNVTKATPTQERDRKELALMRRLKEALDRGKRISTVGMTAEESAMVRAFQFLSEKPLLHVLNVSERALNSEAVKAAAAALGPNTVAICARTEKEIAELQPEDRAEFLRDLGIGEPASRTIIRACYAALGLRSFITSGDPDVHAWTIHVGDTALTAAGKIHSDLARGFIRAEVISYDDFLKCGSIKEAKNQGKMKLEGKDYVVQDGDIILIRFKV